MSDEAEKTVPYERFAEVNAKLKEALGRVATLEAGQADALKEIETRAKLAEKQAAKLSADFEAATKRAAELETQVETERLGATIAGAGITDPDLVDLVRGKYAATKDEKGARPEFGAWYAEWAKEKPWAPKPGVVAKPPSANAGAKSDLPGKLDPSRIRDLSGDALKAAMDEYRQARRA